MMTATRPYTRRASSGPMTPPTPLVGETVTELGLSPAHSILELGCGEGRDAIALLRRGLGVAATDISPEAVTYCQRKYPEYAERFSVLDCVNGALSQKYDFIYAVAVLHMLTEEDDRAAFWRFIREHLNSSGCALVLSMGDGTVTWRTDPDRAFEQTARVHQASGKVLPVPSATCRTVNFDTLRREISDAGLELVREGLTSCEPEFDVMMYVLVRAKK